MEAIGVREARQNLSVYLARVRAGESFTVTDHGTPVAVLGPVPPGDDPFAPLVALGLVDPPKPRGPMPPPLAFPPGPPTSEILDDLRQERDL